MSMVAFVASVLLGAAFLIAGGAKLAAGAAWPAQAAAFGTPSVVIPVLPWLELTVGATVAAQVTRPWPELVALAMLVAFTGAIVKQMRADEPPACACFGAWSATPVGRTDVIRNAVLMLLAVLAAIG